MLIDSHDDEMPPMMDRVLDDGMPPLVEYPAHTLTWSTDDFWNNEIVTVDTYQSATLLPNQTRFEVIEECVSITGSPPPWYEQQQGLDDAQPRNSHNKKRDASYIPRPPNAFILFRSSFIRSNQVPGKIEGNHSSLSKIVGKVWTKLPPEERKFWEEKAAQAQIEHRKRYPDWRFRPSANAAAKLLSKVKDGPPRKNPPRNKALRVKMTSESAKNVVRKRRQRNENEDEDLLQELSGNEARCSKIAEFLDQGIKGADLIIAVQEWDRSGREVVTQHIPQDLQTPEQTMSMVPTGNIGQVIQSSWQPRKEAVLNTTVDKSGCFVMGSVTTRRDHSPERALSSTSGTACALQSVSSRHSTPTPELSQSPTISEASTVLCDHLPALPASQMSQYDVASLSRDYGWYNLFPSSYEEKSLHSGSSLVDTNAFFCNSFPAVYSTYSSLQGWAGEPVKQLATWAI